MKLFLLALLGIFALAHSKKIPEEFYGKFKLDKSENFDEYLEKKGVNWILRKMIGFATVTKIFGPDPQNEGKWVMENLTSKKNTKYSGFTLGEEFEAEGLDGNKHKITFDFNDGVLSEKHVPLDKVRAPETYFYTIEDGKLVLKMQYENIVTRRWFIKE